MPHFLFLELYIVIYLIVAENTYLPIEGQLSVPSYKSTKYGRNSLKISSILYWKNLKKIISQHRLPFSIKCWLKKPALQFLL